MHIQKVISSISFQKHFSGNANIINDGKIEECNIYELNFEEDKDYFVKLKENKDWKKAVYLDELAEDWPLDFFYEKTYVLENKKEDCLGFVNVDYSESDRIEISLLETCPKLTHKKKSRKIKHVGQELINFVIKLAQERELDCVTVPIVRVGAEDFYKKCGFQISGFVGEDAILEADDFDYVLAKNTESVNQ